MLFFGKKANNDEARETALRDALLAGGTSRASEPAKKAITFCELCIEEYEWWFEYNETKWHHWQAIVIVGGVVATLAGVITLPDDWVPPILKSFGWLRGLPAGLVTIASGYLSSFTFKEDAVRHEMTAGYPLDRAGEVCDPREPL